MENSPVESIDAERDRVTVRIAKHHITGRNLVLSAGSWSSLIPVSRSGAPTSIPTSVPVKGHLAGYQLPPGSLRPILRHGLHYVVQRKNGFTVAGSSEETCGFNRSVNPERIREIRDEIGSFYTPLLTKEPTRNGGFPPGIEHHGPVISRVQNKNTPPWTLSKWHSSDATTPLSFPARSWVIQANCGRLAQPAGYGRVQNKGSE